MASSRSTQPARSQEEEAAAPASSSPVTGAGAAASRRQQEDMMTRLWRSPYAMTPVYTGALGTGVGVTVGALKGQSKLLYGLHLGIGYGVFGGVFAGTLFGMRQVRGGEDDTLNWVAAGATSGAVTALITGGPRKMVGGAVVFGTLGVVARYVCGAVDESVEAYKAKRAEQLLLTMQKEAGGEGSQAKP